MITLHLNGAVPHGTAGPDEAAKFHGQLVKLSRGQINTGDDRRRLASPATFNAPQAYPTVIGRLRERRPIGLPLRLPPLLREINPPRV